MKSKIKCTADGQAGLGGNGKGPTPAFCRSICLRLTLVSLNFAAKFQAWYNSHFTLFILLRSNSLTAPSDFQIEAKLVF